MNKLATEGHVFLAQTTFMLKVSLIRNMDIINIIYATLEVNAKPALRLIKCSEQFIDKIFILRLIDKAVLLSFHLQGLCKRHFAIEGVLNGLRVALSV